MQYLDPKYFNQIPQSIKTKPTYSFIHYIHVYCICLFASGRLEYLIQNSSRKKYLVQPVDFSIILTRNLFLAFQTKISPEYQI